MITNTVEIELNEMKSLLSEYNRVTCSTICSFDKNSVGYAELKAIRTKMENYLKQEI